MNSLREKTAPARVLPEQTGLFTKPRALFLLGTRYENLQHLAGLAAQVPGHSDEKRNEQRENGI